MTLPLFLLALLTADPGASDLVATAPADAAAPPTAAQTAPDEPTIAPDGERLPQGAPVDDFAFVAWCHGVLSGHMDLAQRVKELLPLDEEQQAVGSAYLRGYEEALSGAPEGRMAEGQERAKQAQAAGFSNWERARNADMQLAADTYLGYQLPGRCEHAAIRLSGNPNLFRMTTDAGELIAAAPEPAAAEVAETAAPPKPGPERP